MSKNKPRLSVTKESDSGLNQRFHDNKTGQEFTRRQLVKEIDRGKYSGYHHYTTQNGTEVIRSNPDGNEGNNLG